MELKFMAIQHNPLALKQTYLGPEVPIGIDRKCYSYSSGLAPSYIPPCLLTIGSRKYPVEQLVLKPLVTPGLLIELKDDLKNHLEGRVQLFFNQMMLLYKTGLSFAVYKHADIQVGQVPSSGGNAPTYVGAHSGTLPTLRLTQSEFRDTSTSFAKSTSFYYGWNTTVYLPEIVNQIDSAIDKLGNNGSLRDTATAILNDVSAGTVVPKDGLHRFLTTLVNVIGLIKNKESEQRQIILESYDRIADNYLDNLDNGYPLIQKLCLRPIDEVVDEQFYMNVQADMHTHLQSEVQYLQPQIVIMPQLPADIDLKLLQGEVASKFTNVTPTVQTYVKLCTLADAVRATAIRYFIYLHQITPEERNRDLERILSIKSSKTVDRIGLSGAASSLHQVALQALRSQTQEPRNMNLILLSLLTTVGRDLLSSQPAPLQTTEQASDSPAARDDLRSQIQAKIDKLQEGAAVKRYIKSCIAAKKVQDAAKLFFDELLELPNSVREKEIDRLFGLKKSAVGSAGLSQKTLCFYGEALAVIQQSKTKNPRSMPLILSRVLLDVTKV